MTAEQKLSKIETLRTAQNYIKTLAGLMNDEQTDDSLDGHDEHHDQDVHRDLADELDRDVGVNFHLGTGDSLHGPLGSLDGHQDRHHCPLGVQHAGNDDISYLDVHPDYLEDNNNQYDSMDKPAKLNQQIII